MKSLEVLKAVLEASVKRSGPKPLTTDYLLNLVKLAIKAETEKQARVEAWINETLGEDAKWGSD